MGCEVRALRESFPSGLVTSNVRLLTSVRPDVRAQVEVQREFICRIYFIGMASLPKCYNELIAYGMYKLVALEFGVVQEHLASSFLPADELFLAL